LDPGGKERDAEEVVHKHEWVANDAREQAGRPLDAKLEVAEIAYLKSFEVGVCNVS